jgi:CBS domain-containing protein
MNAIDIMTTPVITVAPDTPVSEISALLVAHQISGVPVVENRRVVGLLNEYELLHRHEIGTEGCAADKSWWARLVEGDQLPIAYVKSHARHARDLMTRHVVSVSAHTPVREIASIFATRAIRRIVVLREQQLIGIVTRANIVRAVAAMAQASPAAGAQSDETIRMRLLAELERQPWWNAGQSTAFVSDGVVHFRGLVDNEDERQAARVAAENVPGVRGIEDTRTTWVDWQGMY